MENLTSINIKSKKYELKDDNLSPRVESLISWLLVVLGALVYVSLIFNNNVWLDEAFTASLVRTDMAGVLSRSMADTLPPLYNIILKIATDILGYNVPVMKLVSVTPMILTMLLSATVVRKRHGFFVSTLYTLSLMSMPYLLYFGVEIRMYSLGFFFATASGIYAYECIVESSRKNWIIFTLLSVLSGYSHHFAFVTVGFVYLYILIHFIFRDIKNIKRFFICLAFTFILYFPCLLVTLKQFKSVSGYFSMPEITLSVFIKYMRYPYTVGLTLLSIILLVTVFVLFLTTVFRYIKNEEKELHFYALFLFLVFYGVLLFGTIISKIMTANIFVDRYLFFALGLIWLFFSIEIKEFKNKLIYLFAIILVILCGICGYIREFNIEYSSNANEIDSYLEENVHKGDVIYTLEDHEEMAYCLPFYEEKLSNYEELSDAIDASNTNNSTIYLTVIDYYEYDFKELDKYGLKADFIGDFSFDRYNFKLYKLIKK